MKFKRIKNRNEFLKHPVDQRRHMHRCVFIFRCLNGIIDFDLNLRHNSAFHNYKTRQCNKLRLPAPKTNWGRQKLTYQASNAFKNHNLETQGTKLVLLFKKKCSFYRSFLYIFQFLSFYIIILNIVM